MNRFVYLLGTILCLLCMNLSAQRTVAYFNSELIFYVQKQNNPDEILHLLVQGDVSAIEQFAQAHEGRIIYTVKDIASVRIRASYLNALLHANGIQRVEGYHGNGRILDDQTDIHANITSVKEGQLPLTQAYTGKDVVVGILDTGIEIDHDDFKDSTGQTRIKYLWDQVSTTGGVTPAFGYGQEWDSTAIQNGNCTHNEAANYYGHGSNVTGVAAGNGLALNNYQGVAPQADIISVACDLGENFLNNVADATAYIYQRATQLGKPCVISSSVGTYNGSHDGADLPAQFISALINQQQGRSFCASAGNAGNILLHLGYTVEQDSAYTWFRYEPTISRVYYEIWASKENFNEVFFSVGADKPSPSFAKRLTSPYYNIQSNFNLSSGVDSLKDTLFVDNNRIGILNLYAVDYNDSTYKLIVQIFPDSTTYLWRFTTKGSGYFDCWSHPLYTGTSNTVKTNLPLASNYPDIARYRIQDTRKTIVSSFTCSKEVIAVANYVNRNQFINYSGNTTSYATDTVGARVISSSQGPSRDDRLKPEIAAPGGGTLAPGQLSTLAQLIVSDPTKVAQGGLHNVNGGTSMSSPVVGGIIALYLEKYPDAGWNQVRNAMKWSAKSDTFTGTNLPDTKWGWGKINAFDMLTINLVYGCTDSNSINYNPLATIDDGSCVNDTLVTIYGCMDSLALNYNPLANADDGSCIYDTITIIYGCTDTSAMNYNPLANTDDGSCVYDTTSTGNQLDISIALFPNPATHTVFVQLTRVLDGELILCDITGRIILTQALRRDRLSHSIDVSAIAPGLYLCYIAQGNKKIYPVKLTKL